MSPLEISFLSSGDEGRRYKLDIWSSGRIASIFISADVALALNEIPIGTSIESPQAQHALNVASNVAEGELYRIGWIEQPKTVHSAAPRIVTSAADEVLQRGNWIGLGELGRGGQGVVFSAADVTWLDSIWNSQTNAASRQGATEQDILLSKRNLGRSFLTPFANQHNQPVMAALKLLHGTPSSWEVPARERLSRSIEGMRQVRHPALQRIFDGVPDEGWFAAELFSNGTLADHQNQFYGRVDEALAAFRELVAGVAELHKKGIVHRDIKPANLFLGHDGRLVLGDFGLVSFADDQHTRLSESWENVGSRDWMPGWAHGIRLEKIPFAFDVFGLGKVLWSMISGKKKLQLWYWDEPPNRLEDQFPKDWRISWVTSILNKTVREKRVDTFSDASELLERVDEVLRAIGIGADPSKRIKVCTACGSGHLERGESSSSFVLETGSRERIYSEVEICRTCGHIRWFRKSDQ